MMMDLIIYFSLGISLGAIFGFVTYRYWRKSLIKNAQSEGQELIEEANENLEILKIEQEEKLNEIEMELWTKAEPDILKSENKINDLEEKVEEKKSKYEQYWQSIKSKNEAKHQAIRNREVENKKFSLFFQDKKSNLKSVQKELIQHLAKKIETTPEDIKQQIKNKFIDDVKKQISKELESSESEARERQEELAKRLLDIAIDRFARSYCPERGIAPVFFPEGSSKSILKDAKDIKGQEIIKKIQDFCGCDIIVEDDNEMIGIAGFDPVRRELTRRVLERLLKEKKTPQLDFVVKTCENQKRELYKQIKHDGDAIVKELKLEGVHPEIRQMMGSLRYRYSFTQNQYFHCGEVGWLCGLLSSEIGVDIKAGRRSGMLHDIGKSMDHALDGGHAVIGANFIATRGESSEIVHNVRAHHFDEQPNSVHAFLVIAADAVSGARPGARRSTLETYAQKITELQDIAKSFDGVTDCFILNGGRECRVYVNNKKINDHLALDLSQKIAVRIENECNYPGQIKVVVVRETIIHEQTAGKPPHNRNEKFKEEESA